MKRRERHKKVLTREQENTGRRGRNGDVGDAIAANSYQGLGKTKTLGLYQPKPE